MRLIRGGVVFCAAAALVLSGALLISPGARSTTTAAPRVTVDLKAKRQTIDGFGTTWRVWSDPHVAQSANINIPPSAQASILRALYGKLGLTRVRPFLDPGAQPTPGAAIDFRRTDAHAALIKQARPYGLKTVFPGPVYLEGWMQAHDPTQSVDWSMAMIQRMRQDGVQLALYSPLNEPQIAGDFSPQWLHDVVVELGQRLRAAGFKTKLVIPDDENPTDAYRRAVAVLQDPNARQYVGALAYHIYKWDRGDMIKMRRLATQYKLPLWMTEYSNTSYTDWASSFDWADRMHVLLTDGGVDAVDYLWGFFGSWVKTDTMLSINFDNGQFQSYTPTSIYWITGQYSRFVRPGYVRVAASSSSKDVLVSAYMGPKRAIVVVTNTSSATQTLRTAVVGGQLKGAIQPVQSSESEHWKNLAQVRPKKGVFTATLPPQSITTFVAKR
jgi:O-glycosyl hydrolase